MSPRCWLGHAKAINSVELSFVIYRRAWGSLPQQANQFDIFTHPLNGGFIGYVVELFVEVGRHATHA